VCLFIASGASAQTAEPRHDFSSLAATQTSVDVIADSGRQTRGRLLRFDAESLTLESDRREITFDRQHVAQVYQRGDSLKNGMLIGLGIGAGMGVVTGTTSDCGGFFEPARPCTAGENAQRALVLGGVFGAIGMGIGAGIDALFTGRRLLYDAAAPRRPASMTMSAGASRRGAGLRVMMAW
jgi:hypothetical protein